MRNCVSAVAVLLLLCGPVQASDCDADRGQKLKSTRSAYLNLYAFSTFDDARRCSNLRAAIDIQVDLAGWAAACARDDAPLESRYLEKLTSRARECL